MICIRVFVVDPRGEPLMPMQPARARQMLSNGKARMFRRTPFTIQLLEEVTEPVLQPLVVGIDDGAKSVGIAIALKRSVKPDSIVFAGTIDVTNQIRSTLDTRRSYRRTRRYRLRYRKPRFENRTRTKCFVCGQNAMKGHETCRLHLGSRPDVKLLENFYLTPSLRAKKDCTLRVVRKLQRIAPLTHARVEVGRFDLQKLANQTYLTSDTNKGQGMKRIASKKR